MLAVVVARSIDRLVRVENRILGEWMCVGGEGEEEGGRGFYRGKCQGKAKSENMDGDLPGN